MAERSPAPHPAAAPERTLDSAPPPILDRVDSPVDAASIALTSGRRYELSASHDGDHLTVVGRRGEEVPLLVLEPPGCPPRELTPQMKSVIFDLENERVDLVWSGAMQVLAPFPKQMCESIRRAVRWNKR